MTRKPVTNTPKACTHASFRPQGGIQCVGLKKSPSPSASHDEKHTQNQNHLSSRTNVRDPVRWVKKAHHHPPAMLFSIQTKRDASFRPQGGIQFVGLKKAHHHPPVKLLKVKSLPKSNPKDSNPLVHKHEKTLLISNTLSRTLLCE